MSLWNKSLKVHVYKEMILFRVHVSSEFSLILNIYRQPVMAACIVNSRYLKVEVLLSLLICRSKNFLVSEVSL